MASKLSGLRPLIESKDGQHLTVYVPNTEGITDLRRRLRESLDIAYEYLAPVMSPEALIKFVAPLHNLISDANLLRSIKGNLGIFRSETSFRVIGLPVPVESSCVLATTFHVKPLLRWMQLDREFLLLGIGDDSATLYHGSQSSFRTVDTILFTPQIYRSAKYQANIEWLSNWLMGLNLDSSPRLFVAGRRDVTTTFLKSCRYANVHPRAIWPSFEPNKINEICEAVRNLVRFEAEQSLRFSILEFHDAENVQRTNNSLFQIAKAVVRGQVRKLIVADGISIFGTLDRNSGGIEIHPTHLDHKDDDLLDDLAQEVLARGGDVVVAPLEQIPKGRPILAIMDKPELVVESQKALAPALPERRAV